MHANHMYHEYCINKIKETNFKFLKTFDRQMNFLKELILEDNSTYFQIVFLFIINACKLYKGSVFYSKLSKQ